MPTRFDINVVTQRSLKLLASLIFLNEETGWQLYYGLDNPGFESRWGAIVLVYLVQHAHAGSAAHPTSCSMCTGDSVRG